MLLPRAHPCTWCLGLRVSNFNQFFLAFSIIGRYPKSSVVSNFLVCVRVISDHFRDGIFLVWTSDTVLLASELPGNGVLFTIPSSHASKVPGLRFLLLARDPGQRAHDENDHSPVDTPRLQTFACVDLSWSVRPSREGVRCTK